MRLVYLSPIPFRSYTQRPHQFVRFCNERGGHTLWVEPYPGRLPKFTDIGGHRPGASHRQCQAGVEVIAPRGLDPVMAVPPFRRLAWRWVLERLRAFVAEHRWLLVVGRPSYLALHLLRNTTPSATCYDAMDDFPEFYRGFSRWLSHRIETRVAGAVDTVFVTSVALQEKFARRGLKTEMLRNGFDADQALLETDASGPPVFGYVGTIGAWFDWELVVRMAQQLPEVRFDLAGPVVAAPPPLPANVRLLGESPAELVPTQLRSFTAGLIPFRVDQLTASVDPIKYYEYQAMGLPIITTRFGDMARRGSDPRVCLVDERTDYRGLLRHITSLEPCSSEALHRFRAINCWRARFEQSRFLRENCPAAAKRTAR